MKLIAWAFGTLFAVWLAAFVSIKVYDLGCVNEPSICLSETGVWFRKLVLLEWASKWQTLISGVCAVAAGGFVLIAAKYQIDDNRTRLANEKRRQTYSDIFVAFQSIVHLGPMWTVPHAEKVIYVEKAIESVRALNHCCAELTLDINHCLFQLRKGPENFNKSNKAYLMMYTYILAQLSNIVDSDHWNLSRVSPTDLQLEQKELEIALNGTGVSLAELPKLLRYCKVNPTG